MSTAGSEVESAPGSAPESPKNKVKFLCSHGGKILPRPADGHLKYVGGETRVISVSRDICFLEIMKKITYLIEGEMVLKYQLIPEDLDALVSVKSDEDLRHMFEEYDRHESLGTPRLRTFLFPANPLVIDHQMERYSLEQRYINSINGIIFHPNPNPMSLTLKPPSLNTATFSISSACSSPRSPPECFSDGLNNHDIMPLSLSHNKQNSPMPRVRSSPSLCNLSAQQPQSIGGTTHHHHHQNQRQVQTAQSHHHFHQQQSINSGYQYHKPPLDKSGPEHLLRVRSTSLADYYRFQVDHSGQHSSYNYGPPSSRPSRGGGGGHVCCSKCLHVDDYGSSYGNGRYERGESVPGSPVPQSPHQRSYTSKGWESIVSSGHI